MSAAPLIQLRDVVKTLGVNRVLDGVSLNIQRGEITAIIGKSGSGKSVLLKHIIGLLDPDEGSILFEGRSRAAMSPADKKSLRRKFSYVFQETALFDFLTVVENVALPLAERKGAVPAEILRRVRDKLNQLDLYDVDHKYPSQLSGGMKKRVALARALVTEPDIVLFDEPTTGLDPIRKNAVHSMISDYQRRFGFTGVVVSHEIPDIFFIAQRVAMIDGGRIRFEGTPEEIQRAADSEVRNFIEGLESPRDPMTGIASHSIGQQHLRREMSRLQRHRKPFSIVLMAIGHPQNVDRIAGHMASQTVFKRFADHVIQNSYLTDMCFRYAINKIMVVLPETDEAQARSFCRKITRTLQQSAFFDALDTTQRIGCTLSAGVVQARPDSGLDDLIAAAEKVQAVFFDGSSKG